MDRHNNYGVGVVERQEWPVTFRLGCRVGQPYKGGADETFSIAVTGLYSVRLPLAHSSVYQSSEILNFFFLLREVF